MKKLISFIFLIISINIYSQNIKEINSKININDSLNFKKEIRVYRGFGTTNYISIFRIYQNNLNKWNIEYYNNTTFDVKTEKFKFNIKKITSKNSSDLIWNKILRTNIINLPNMNEIRWKMKKRGDIKLNNGKHELLWEQIRISDGIAYFIQVKDDDSYNQVWYYNPEQYLDYYPKIDELIFFSELLSVIRDEFNIWSDI